IGKYQQSAQESLNKRRQELLAPLLNRIDEAIKAIGKEASYTFIFDSSAGLIFYPESEDITPLILKKLNAPK
ncbi:MAG TPA: OmpH family outer membrane protein, partial [Saprospiraceae bacterium]|nr:OmpH family outer membrane protein [Saprospiraceae bacterium]